MNIRLLDEHDADGLMVGYGTDRSSRERRERVSYLSACVCLTNTILGNVCGEAGETNNKGDTRSWQIIHIINRALKCPSVSVCVSVKKISDT